MMIIEDCNKKGHIYLNLIKWSSANNKINVANLRGHVDDSGHYDIPIGMQLIQTYRILTTSIKDA